MKNRTPGFNQCIALLFLFFTLLFSACHPGHRGKVVISNQTAYNLILKYQTSLIDTLIVIKPRERTDVLVFGGLGEGRMYTRCLDQFREISLEVSGADKRLLKDIKDAANWEMVNKNKWRYSNKEILCVFRIDETDLK